MGSVVLVILRVPPPVTLIFSDFDFNRGSAFRRKAGSTAGAG